MNRFVLVALSIAGLALVPLSASAATHTVDQVGFTFVPDDLTIDVGDTVEWVSSDLAS